MKIAFAVMSPGQREVFKQKNEIDLAYSVPGLGRFRCNVFIQRGTIGLVFRVIPMRIPSIEELNLPEVLQKIAMEERGLVLVTGTTGSGKVHDTRQHDRLHQYEQDMQHHHHRRPH